MRIIATTLLVTLLTAFAWGQKEVIIESNSVISKIYNEEAEEYLSIIEQRSTPREKELCSEVGEDIISLIAGESKQIRLDIDTFGLGGNGAFECMDCNLLAFGSAGIVLDVDGQQTDSLLYSSSLGIDAGLDTLHIQYCNADTCSEIQELIFLVRREGESFYPSTITLGQEEVTQVEAVNNLPGSLRCSFFIECPDQYEGRDQIAYFADYNMPTNEVIYHSSRFAGVDSVCVTLCDEFGICDTTHFSFRVDVTSADFPFYEDFYSDNPYPNTSNWLDKEVFVNNQLAVDTRSIGVASFDGIDFRGRAYGNAFGPSDRLTSTYIDIPSSAMFPTLSFWSQRGGLADRPEVKDSLVVQFKNESGDWVSVLQLLGVSTGISPNVVDSFQFHTIQLGPDYQYDRFQFRFVAHGDRTGFRDVWNLDYIRLDNNPVADSIFNDISFTKEPDFILNNYTSLPWRHFQPIAGTELKSTIDVGLYNHFSTAQNVSPSSIVMEENNTAANLFGQVPTLFNGSEINVENSVSLNRSYDLMGDDTGFINVWDTYFANMTDTAFDGLEEVEISLQYNLQNNSQNNVDFVDENDQVQRSTKFSDYFAYDDGTAELGLQTEAGLQVAVAYEASVADTLRGVQFNFPFTGEDISEQEFQLKIWIGELDENPVYDEVYQPAYASTFFDTLQGFTSYQLFDEFGLPATLAIPAGTFYVGWEQKTSCLSCIAVGYDRNRQQGFNFIYVDNGDGFALASDIRPGALMIRPVMGGGEPIGSTALKPSIKRPEIAIFPNPTRGIVYFDSGNVISENSTVSLFNSAGQLLLKEPFQQQLNVNHLPGGLYFVQIFDPETQMMVRERLIISK